MSSSRIALGQHLQDRQRRAGQPAMRGVVGPQLQRLTGWGLFASSAAVLVAGLAATAGIWVLLTRLLRYHWPWGRYLSPGQTVSDLSETR